MFELSEPIKKDEVRVFEETMEILEGGVFYFVITYCPHKLEKWDAESNSAWRFEAFEDDP